MGEMSVVEVDEIGDADNVLVVESGVETDADGGGDGDKLGGSVRVGTVALPFEAIKESFVCNEKCAIADGDRAGRAETADGDGGGKTGGTDGGGAVVEADGDGDNGGSLYFVDINPSVAPFRSGDCGNVIELDGCICESLEDGDIGGDIGIWFGVGVDVSGEVGANDTESFVFTTGTSLLGSSMGSRFDRD